MSIAEKTLAFAAQAPGVLTRKALASSLMSVVTELGATTFACLYLKGERGNMVIDRSISNLSRQWQELYLQRGYDATDPVFQGVVRGGAYGYWDELTRGVVLGKQGREVMGKAREHNMADGFTKRVTLDTGGAAVMMVAGQALERDARSRAALRMAFDVFANEGARLMRMAPSAAHAEAPAGDLLPLSKTQLRVLLMRSEGLSNKQVAIMMGRHEKTIECHVTEILRRLQARNMIDAIRIATRLKLIV